MLKQLAVLAVAALAVQAAPAPQESYYYGQNDNGYYNSDYHNSGYVNSGSDYDSFNLGGPNGLTRTSNDYHYNAGYDQDYSVRSGYNRDSYLGYYDGGYPYWRPYYYYY